MRHRKIMLASLSNQTKLIENGRVKASLRYIFRKKSPEQFPFPDMRLK